MPQTRKRLSRRLPYTTWPSLYRQLTFRRARTRRLGLDKILRGCTQTTTRRPRLVRRSARAPLRSEFVAMDRYVVPVGLQSEKRCLRSRTQARVRQRCILKVCVFEIE